MEIQNLKKQYEEIVTEYNKLLERIEKVCLQASRFVPQDFLNSVKEELYKHMQKDFSSRLDYLKTLFENNSIAEIKQEIKIQKDLLFTLDNEIITSYEKVLVNFLEI